MRLKSFVLCITIHALSATSHAQPVQAYGDSITCGVGRSKASYIDIIAAAKGWDVKNHCLSGHQLADFFAGAYYGPTLTLPTSHAVMLLGYNDMRLNGNSAAALVSFQRALGSMIAWNAIPTADVTLASGESVTYKGEWGATSAWPRIGRNSGTTGDTATFSITGRTAYIDLIQFAGYTRGIDISIDGSDYGVFSGANFVPTYFGLPYAPYLVRIPNLSEGSHTVVLTVTEGTGSAYFNWAAGFSPSPARMPSVTVGNALRMQREKYGDVPSAPFNAGSDAASDLYNQVIAQAVRDFAGDGLDVGYADASAAVDPLSDIGPDGIHPNDLGYSHIAAAFLESINYVGRIRGLSARHHPTGAAR